MGLACRMLSSMSDAQDVSREAFLRSQDIRRGDVQSAGAYLAKTVTRLCLDELKSARAFG